MDTLRWCISGVIVVMNVTMATVFSIVLAAL